MAMQNADGQNEKVQYRVLQAPFVQTSSTIASLKEKQTEAKWPLFNHCKFDRETNRSEMATLQPLQV
jgi:hypothetical protein